MTNPFSHSKPVTPPIFSGRQVELSNLRESIIVDNESVSVSGFNGIGKSSLILTILEDLNANAQGVFPVHIKEHQFQGYLKGHFLSLVVQEICIAIWTKVLNQKFLDLLEQSIYYPRGGEIELSPLNLVKRIYKIVVSESLSAKGERSSDFGASLVFNGKITESNEFSLARKPLISTEFLLLVDELMEILSDYGYKKIIIVCDQLNHAAPEINYAMVSQCFELLSTKNIIFLVSAINRRLGKFSSESTSTEDMLKSFGRWIELRCFKDISDVKEFSINCLKKAGIKNLQIDRDFYRGVLAMTEGYPWFVVKLMEIVYGDVMRTRQIKFTSSFLDRYEKRFVKAIHAYKEEEGCVPTAQLESLLIGKPIG